MTATTATPTAEDIAAGNVPAEWIALAAHMNATHAAQLAKVAAANYARTVVLRRGALEVHLEIGPAESGAAFQVTGTGIEYGHGGRHRAGDTRTRYFADLDGDAGAKAYANGWAANLIAKGYRITSTTR
jgi:hypothetical protein